MGEHKKEQDKQPRQVPAKTVSLVELARMGGGRLAYVRPIRVEEAMRILGAPIQAPPGIELYAAFHADGQPLAIADSKAGALANVLENDLEPASVH